MPFLRQVVIDIVLAVGAACAASTLCAFLWSPEAAPAGLSCGAVSLGAVFFGRFYGAYYRSRRREIVVFALFYSALLIPLLSVALLDSMNETSDGIGKRAMLFSMWTTVGHIAALSVLLPRHPGRAIPAR